MKVRSGFVSNSSSSSFVIHRSYLTKAQIDELNVLYNKLLDKEEIYDDGGEGFNVDANYIEFGCYGGDGREVMEKKLASFGVQGDMIYHTEG